MRLAAIVAVLSEQSAPTLERLPWLASAAALPPSTAGQALDDLVRAGILRTGTGGAIEFVVPALADRLRLEHGTRWRTALHRRIVRERRSEEIAPYLAELPPSPPDPEAAGLLLEAAAKADFAGRTPLPEGGAAAARSGRHPFPRNASRAARGRPRGR